MSAEMPDVAVVEPSVESFLALGHAAGERDRRTAIVIAVVLASHLPFVVCHFLNLWQKAHYQFFPFLMAGIGWIAWTRWPPSGLRSWRSKPRLTLLLPGLTVLCVAVLLFSLWLAAVAAILTVGGVLSSLGGRDRWRDWLPVWALLWLLIPPPRGWDEDFTFRMQSVTSRASSATLDVLGVRHVMEGHVLELPGHRLFVEEACSGVNSIFVLLAATALFVVAARRPVIWAGLLLASSVVWAGLANVGRVVTVAVVQSWWDVDLTAGLGHTALGFSMVAVALLMLASTDRLLAFLLGRIDLCPGDDLESYFDEEFAAGPLTRAWNWCAGGGRSQDIDPACGDSATEAAARGPTARPYGRRTLRLIVVGFVLLGILQLVGLVSFGSRRFVAHPASFRRSDLFDRSALPTVLDGWAQVQVAMEDRGGVTGAHSRIWHYRSGSCTCRISVDYPFSHWHELGLCYVAQGWTIVDRTGHASTPESGAEHDPYVEVQMGTPGGRNGLLLFSLVDEGGRTLPGPLTVRDECIRKVVESPLWWLLAGRATPATESTTFQVQALCSCPAPSSTVERQAVRKLFLRAREEILSAYRLRQQRISDD